MIKSAYTIYEVVFEAGDLDITEFNAVNEGYFSSEVFLSLREVKMLLKNNHFDGEPAQFLKDALKEAEEAGAVAIRLVEGW